MVLVVGLGNPGEEYKNTRHNAGFLVAEALLEQIRSLKSQTLNKSKIQIFKSQDFMNESGNFVKDLTVRYSLSPNNLYIIHDDLDIKLGEFKIQFGRGPKDHNGLKSIDEALGTDQYWHVRIGIENRPERMGSPASAKATAGEKYVLQNFTTEEMKKLRTVIKEVCKKLAILLKNTK